MSKLINCYHIKKKRRQLEEEEDEDEEEASPSPPPPTTTTTTNCESNYDTTKSNDCDKNNNNNNNNDEKNCTHQSDSHGGINRRCSPVAVANGQQRQPNTKRGHNSTSLAHRLLALTLMCLTLSCLHDDWLTLMRHHRQLCMNYAQETTTTTTKNSTKSNQHQQQTTCDDDWWPIKGGSQLVLQLAEANVDANRLYEDLMMTYNRIVLPVQNNTDKVVVRLGLKLSQLMDVNLKNQMMTTNVWLNQEWTDYKLKWDPSEYGGIEDINLPAEQIWLPDIVLYNSAEGYFAVSIMTKAKVRYNGHVTWNPPAIFRSSCQIDITYFPFDSQNCHLKFGSWTFGTKIDLRHINDTDQSIEYGTDLSEYYQNVEWDIMRATAKRNVITYQCCPNDFYPDVTFNFTLRRKPLFYTVNLILPCIGITILSFLVFYLPSDSGEKVTLTISILVSLIFFLCVLIETIPSTSTAMPLLGKYLVFTMILITLSVCATVGVLNIHFRTPSTHSMSPWAKRWCIEILPKYLFMNVPQYQSQPADSSPILPEQLIYPHNQAYQSLTSANWSSLVKAAQQQQHLNNSGNNNNNNNTSQLVCNSQQKTGQANGGGGGGQSSLLRPTMIQLLDVNKLSHQSSTSSSFLPYLTSEAARRLQMQRSRSSERISSNNCDSPATNNNNSNASNQRLPKQQVSQAPALSGSGANATRDTTSDHHGRAGPSRAETTTTKNQERKCSASSGKSTKKSGRPFWRMFGQNSSNKSSLDTTNTVDSRAELHRQQKHQKQKQKSSSKASASRQATTVPNFRSSSSSSSSSSESESDFEHNYQHHNHFQARASICSTNMWRIGPTRRCSMAAAASVGQANYATFYRPLANLSASNKGQPHNQATTGGGLQPVQVVRTISGNRPNATTMHQQQQHNLTQKQHSSGDQFDSAGSSESPLMGGFKNATANSLASAAATTNMPTRTKALHNQRQQQGFFLPTSALISATGRHHQVYPVPSARYEQEMQHLTSNARLQGPSRQILQPANLVGLIYSPQSTPPPPPPLPPLPSEMYIQQQQQQHSHPAPTGGSCQSHSMSQAAPLNRLASDCRINHPQPHQQLQQQQHQRNLFTGSQLMAERRQHSGSSNQSAGYNTASFENAAASNTASSNTATTVMMLGDRQLPTVASHQPPQFISIHPHLRPYHQQQQQHPQCMTRSHSTDHRLCQYALASTAVGGSVHQQQSHYKGQMIEPMPLIGGGGGGGGQPRHTIGRALGQVYVERLQRQPAICSMKSALSQSVRQSRSINRDGTMFAGADPAMAFRLTPSDPEEAQCFVRRSKSQGSLNRSQHHRQQQQQQQLPYLPDTIYRQCNQHRPPAMGLPSQLVGCDGCSCRAASSLSHMTTNMHHHQQGCNCSAIQAQRSTDSRAMTAKATSSGLIEGGGGGRSPLTPLGFMKLINEVDKAIQNAMFIAQHIDNLDEFESVKENWKYIAMVIDRIFLIVFLFACIVGSAAIFMMVPWSHYTVDQPIDLQLVRSISLNFTAGEPHPRSCRDDF